MRIWRSTWRVKESVDTVMAMVMEDLEASSREWAGLYPCSGIMTVATLCAVEWTHPDGMLSIGSSPVSSAPPPPGV